MELIKLNIPDEEQIEFQIAFVDEPAIESNFMAFAKKANPFKFVELDKSKRLLMGYFMIADLKIPRFSQEKGRFDVVFDKESINKIVRNFSKHGLNRNLNENHETNEFAKNCYVLSHFQIDSELGIQAPKGFKQEPDGSWFGIVRCENDDIYQKALNGEYNGFSIEGDFLEEQFNKLKMEKKQKTLKHFTKSFFLKGHKFETLMLADGETEVVIEPEVEVGAAIVINSLEGEPIPAKPGEYELADGRIIVVVDDGIIAEVIEAEQVTDEEEQFRKFKSHKTLRHFVKSFFSKGQKFESLMLVDGETEVVIEPEVEVGATITINSIAAEIGDYELTDGRIIVVLEAGIVASIIEVEQATEEVKEIIENIVSELEDLAAANDEFRKENAHLKRQFTDLKKFTKEAFERLLEEPAKEPVVKKSEIFGKKPTNYLHSKIK